MLTNVDPFAYIPNKPKFIGIPCFFMWSRTVHKVSQAQTAQGHPNKQQRVVINQARHLAGWPEWVSLTLSNVQHSMVLSVHVEAKQTSTPSLLTYVIACILTLPNLSKPSSRTKQILNSIVLLIEQIGPHPIHVLRHLSFSPKADFVYYSITRSIIPVLLFNFVRVSKKSQIHDIPFYKGKSY